MTSRKWKPFLSTSILLLTMSYCGANFHDDEFVPTARRALFHGVGILYQQVAHKYFAAARAEV